MVSTAPSFPPGRCGLAEVPPEELGPQVLAAWDAFLAVARDPATDLERPSRLPGWTGKDVCTHLGSWPDTEVLTAVLASARAGGHGPALHPDAGNAALVAAHRHEGVDSVLAALEEARDGIAGFFASDDATALGRALSQSTVGPLPVLSLVHAGTFELAVHALDLAPCGAPPPPPLLLDRGLAALLDVTGALAARAGVDLVLGAMTPDGGWGFTSGTAGWTTERLPAGPLDGVGVRGSAVDLLEAAAGRAHVAQLLVTRRMHVQQLGQWMRLAPLLEELPGLPGGTALRTAVGGLSGVAGGVAGVASGVGRALGRLRR